MTPTKRGGEFEGATPGPWQIGREDMQSYNIHGEPLWTVYRRDDDERCQMHLGSRVPLVIARLPGEVIEETEGRMNARLIAAAPDLLAAHDALVDRCERLEGLLRRCTDDLLDALWDAELKGTMSTTTYTRAELLNAIGGFADTLAAVLVDDAKVRRAGYQALPRELRESVEGDLAEARLILKSNGLAPPDLLRERDELLAEVKRLRELLEKYNSALPGDWKEAEPGYGVSSGR